MCKKIFFLSFICLWLGCKEEIVKKPDNFIEKEVMIDIIYDLSLLEAIKYQNLYPLEKFQLTASEYIYKKYKIDSLQFVQNSMFYAADAKTYKKMNEEVNARLEQNKKKFEAQLQKEKKKAKVLEKSKSKKVDSVSDIKNRNL